MINSPVLRAFRTYVDSGTEELGPVPLDQLHHLLRQAEEAIGIREQSIGLYRDERDFLEASPVGNNQFLFFSDRLIYDNAWSRWLSRRSSVEFMVAGVEDAVRAFVYYATHSRDAFERKIPLPSMLRRKAPTMKFSPPY